MKRKFCILIILSLFSISQSSLAGLKDASVVQELYGEDEIIAPANMGKEIADDTMGVFIFFSMAICASKEDPNACFLPSLNKYIQDVKEK